MKCPKCAYLGFEEVDRCRNCGYEFALMASPAMPELSLRSDQADLAPLDDLALVDAAAMPSTQSSRAADLDRAAGQPPPASPTGDLPLFGSSLPLDDDQPLITRPSSPRPPLAVRRSTPEVPRLRSSPRSRTPMFDLNSFDSEPVPPAAAGGRRNEPARAPAWSSTADTVSTAANGLPLAGVTARVSAAAMDLVILAAIDLAVIYLTMKICGITAEELELLPKAPLIAFLTAQNLAYFVGFTLGGQTLGKMATGIKVVSAESEDTLDFGHSLLRTMIWVVLAVPAGLGFLTTLFGQDHRGLHDRFAGTKVVRAST